MPISEFMPQHAKRLWLNRFCAHLETLQPSMNCLTAVKHALAVFPDAAHLEPEEAAEAFVSGHHLSSDLVDFGAVSARLQAPRQTRRLQV